MEQLNVIKKEGVNYKMYALEGALNAYTLGEFQDTLYSVVLESNVVLEMDKLIELDASGVGLLMAAFNDCEDSGHKLYFLSMSNEVEKVIAATGFKYIFNIVNSVTEIS